MYKKDIVNSIKSCQWLHLKQTWEQKAIMHFRNTFRNLLVLSPPIWICWESLRNGGSFDQRTFRWTIKIIWNLQSACWRSLLGVASVLTSNENKKRAIVEAWEGGFQTSETRSLRVIIAAILFMCFCKRNRVIVLSHNLNNLICNY